MINTILNHDALIELMRSSGSQKQPIIEDSLLPSSPSFYISLRMEFMAMLISPDGSNWMEMLLARIREEGNIGSIEVFLEERGINLDDGVDWNRVINEAGKVDSSQMRFIPSHILNDFYFNSSVLDALMKEQPNTIYPVIFVEALDNLIYKANELMDILKYRNHDHPHRALSGFLNAAVKPLQTIIVHSLKQKKQAKSLQKHVSVKVIKSSLQRAYQTMRNIHLTELKP